MIDNNILKELYPGSEGLVYPPMLIHASTNEQLKAAAASGKYMASLKKDGAWYQYVKGYSDVPYLFGRTVSKKTGVFTEKGDNVPHIMSALDELPMGTVLVGEIYYPGKSSKDVVSIMGCLPEKAIKRQNEGYELIHYYIHDILFFNGINLISAGTSNKLRYQILKKIYNRYRLEEYYYIELAEMWEDDIYDRIDHALAEGEEGMVLKLKDGIYEPGKRPSSNLKAKKVDYIDAIIIGFNTPTKEYYGKDKELWEYWIDGETGHRLPIGFHHNEIEAIPVTKPYYMGWSNSRIKIGAYDKEGKIVNIGTIHSGISDTLKEDMSKNPINYINKVCSIQCMELDKDALTIRHGFFKNMHLNKDSKDCLIEDIF